MIEKHVAILNHDEYNMSVIDGVLHGLFGKHLYPTSLYDHMDVKFLIDIISNTKEFEEEM